MRCCWAQQQTAWFFVATKQSTLFFKISVDFVAEV